MEPENRPRGGHQAYLGNLTEFLAFCRYLGSLYPAQVRIGNVLDNFGPNLSTKCGHVGRPLTIPRTEVGLGGKDEV